MVLVEVTGHEPGAQLPAFQSMAQFVSRGLSGDKAPCSVPNLAAYRKKSFLMAEHAPKAIVPPDVRTRTSHSRRQYGREQLGQLLGFRLLQRYAPLTPMSFGGHRG